MFARYKGSDRIGYHLVKRARRSEEAFEKLLKVADRIIIAFALRSGVRGEQIDDLMQDGRITAWKCVHAYDPTHGTKFTTYLVSALKNKYNQQYHGTHMDKRRIRTKSVSLESTMEDRPAFIDGIHDPQADEKFNVKNTEIFLSELMDIIPEKGRKVCQHMINGLTLDQISTKMRITRTKVRFIFDKYVRDHILEAQRNNFL